MASNISLNEIRSRCAQFILDWKDSPGEEKQEGQTFVRELLHVYGISDNRAALYEKRAKKISSGEQGYIDALVPGVLAIEMKSAGKDLKKAEVQALDYLDDLSDTEMPRFVLTCDFKKFRLFDLQGSGESEVIEFPLESLRDNADCLAFLAGYRTQNFGSVDQETASIKAAKIMAGLYEALEGSGYGDHEASVFLVRTLFALYADDAGVWDPDMFTEFLETRTSEDGSDLGAQMSMLFQVLNQPKDKRHANLDEILKRFPYVNGGIFAEALSIPSFDKNMRDKLISAAYFNWSAISPAIFGSLFQAVKDKKARRVLGEHYTTETNIRKAIDPLFLDELIDQFNKSYNDIKSLKVLRKNLSELRILDPACGCGNFLVVAYRELRKLELKVLVRLQELGDRSSIPALYFNKDDLAVNLENFLGIELEEWPAQIAQTALRLAEHQSNMDLEMAIGRAPDSLPLDDLNNIKVGNALQMDWGALFPESGAQIIIGNPPFLGHAYRSKQQTRELKEVWGSKYTGKLDYVTAWYKKASDLLAERPGSRFAFVSTNSITQGEQVPTLFGELFENGWRIRFAHRTFAWTSEASGAASVHCVIVGLDKRELDPKLFLYDSPKSDPIETSPNNINGYLLDADNIFVGPRRQLLSSMLVPTYAGSMANDDGNLIVEKDEYADIASDPVASKYLRRFMMGRELINDLPRWCLWMTDLAPEDLKTSTALKSRIEKVKTHRESSPREGTKRLSLTPQLFGENHQPDQEYLGIPRVFSDTRRWATCAYFPPDVIAGDKVYTCIDSDGLMFSIISSSMFITWQKMIGGRMKSDPSFSNTIVWNNLPLPSFEVPLREQIIEAGKTVLAAREKFPGRSLADHYNPLSMDPDLLKAHAALDKYVDKAFGVTGVVRSNEEREQILFKRFVELTSGD